MFALLHAQGLVGQVGKGTFVKGREELFFSGPTWGNVTCTSGKAGCQGGGLGGESNEGL